MFNVAPFAGAWIEILSYLLNFVYASVAPFAGAWIEIADKAFKTASSGVAPFAGAWIEIITAIPYSMAQVCRSLRGSVD